MSESDPKHQLLSSDTEFIRVLEDLIDVLIANGTIRLTDLPEQALAKITERKQARKRLQNSLDLITDDDEEWQL